MNNNLTKRDITEGVLLFVNFAVLTTLRYLGRPGLVGLVGVLMLFGMTIYWICGIKKFSMIENGDVSGTPAVLFGVSVIYKMLIMTSVAFNYWHSFEGHESFENIYGLTYIIGKIILLVFLFICLHKKATKEVVIAIIYDIYAVLLVPCSMIPLGTSF